MEWVAISFSRGSSQPRDQTLVSCIAVGFFPTESPGKPLLSDFKATAEHVLHLEAKMLGWLLCLKNALGLQAEDRPEAVSGLWPGVPGETRKPQEQWGWGWGG